MQHVLRVLYVFLFALVAPLSSASTIHMVLEQDIDGVATHRAIDLSSIGDGIDPVLQFILLDQPTDPGTAQLLWEASKTPIHWHRNAENRDWRFVDYADLPAGSKIEYRIVLDELGLELLPLRHERTADDDEFGVDPDVIDLLPDATFEVQAHLSVPDRPGHILKQRVTVSQFAAVEDEPEPVLEPIVEDTTPTLEPGPGFDGETPQPESIGGKTTIAIAQWNVVPEQQIAGEFNVGVVAHHIEGVDHVALSLDGGPWIKIEEPSINPRTGSEEYWATLDATDRKGWQEVRAIAVPIAGKPLVLDSLRLYAGENEKLFPEIVLEAGTYKVGDLTRGLGSHTEGWITIRAADGVSRDQVIITGNATGGRDRHLRFEGITRKLGQWDEHYGDFDPHAWWWFDDTRIEGNTRSRWIVHHSSRQYYTDTTITDMQNTFQNAFLLARNVTIERAWEDVCRSFGMMVNVTIETLDRGKFTTYHPDLFQWYNSDVNNFIAQDITSRNNVGQGLFSGDIQNSAFVRMNIDSKETYSAMQMQGNTRNVLIKDCVFDGAGHLRYDKGFKAQDLVIRDSTFGTPDRLPKGWQNANIRIYPKPGG